MCLTCGSMDVLTSGFRAECDATESRLRIQAWIQIRVAESFDKTLGQGEIHPADKRAMLVHERVKGAVAQPDPAVVPLSRFVAAIAKHAN